MISAEDFVQGEIPKNFKTLHLKGNSYVDMSTIIVIPTLGMMHHKPVSSLLTLAAPPNQKRAMLIVEGDEVGEAYEKAVDAILNDPELSSFKYIMSIEDDNVVPPMAHLQLLQSIIHHNFDAMSGLYFAKGEFGFPMAFGDPVVWREQKIFDCKPRDVCEAVSKDEVMEVNAIAMGCAVWRLESLKALKKLDPSKPLFKTWQEHSGTVFLGQTQDMYISQRIRQELGGRIGVDCRVKVGHCDSKTGEVW